MTTTTESETPVSEEAVVVEAPVEETVVEEVAVEAEAQHIAGPGPLLTGLYVTEADGSVRPATAEEIEAYRREIYPGV